MRTLAFALLVGAGTAAAQTPAEAPAPAAPAASSRPRCTDTDSSQAGGGKTKYEVVIGPDGKKVFRIKTGFIICGKVPKPDVLYGLLNSNINYEWESLKQDFKPKILHSVEDSPF